MTKPAEFDAGLKRATSLVLPTGERRRQIRLAAGLSLRQVADPLGVTPMTVLRWERGSRPGDEHAAKYGQLLAALEKAAGRAAS